GTVLCNNEGKYVGTLNAKSGVEPELLIDADTAQRMLLDAESYKVLDEVKRGQYFQRIINLECLPQFLKKACTNKILIQALVDYLKEACPSLRPTDWDEIAYWFTPVQIKALFKAYSENQKFDDAKNLLFSIVSNASLVAVFTDKKSQLELFEMFKKCK